MDANAEQMPAPAPVHDLKEGDNELPSNHDEPKVTYKSFK
jgi:hypothetical protein